MRKYIILFALLLGISLNLQAQETVTVKGKVIDAEGIPMVGVNISVITNPRG